MKLELAKSLAKTAPRDIAGSLEQNAYTYARASKALLREIERLEKELKEVEDFCREEFEGGYEPTMRSNIDG